MKKTIAFMLLAGLTAAVQAGEFQELQGLRAIDLKAAGAQYAVSAPGEVSASSKADMPGADRIIYVPAHRVILSYEKIRQVKAGFYGTREGALIDMDKLLRAFKGYGIKAEGTVQEDYWHSWGFVVAYAAGTVTDYSEKKYTSKTDAERAALRWVAKLGQEGLRPLVPVVETEQSDNGIAYRVKALCHGSSRD